MKGAQKDPTKQPKKHLTNDPAKHPTKVLMLTSQMQLMLVWVIGCAILLIVAWLQILFGHYGENGRDAIALPWQMA